MKQADYAVAKYGTGQILMIWIYEGTVRAEVFNEGDFTEHDDYVELRDIARPKR